MKRKLGDIEICLLRNSIESTSRTLSSDRNTLQMRLKTNLWISTRWTDNVSMKKLVEDILNEFNKKKCLFLKEILQILK